MSVSFTFTSSFSPSAPSSPSFFSLDQTQETVQTGSQHVFTSFFLSNHLLSISFFFSMPPSSRLHLATYCSCHLLLPLPPSPPAAINNLFHLFLISSLEPSHLLSLSFPSVHHSLFLLVVSVSSGQVVHSDGQEDVQQDV